MSNNIKETYNKEDYDEKVEHYRKVKEKEIEIFEIIQNDKITTKEFNKVLGDLGVITRHIKFSKIFKSALDYNDKKTSIIRTIIFSLKGYKNKNLESSISELNEALSNEGNLNIYKNTQPSSKI